MCSDLSPQGSVRGKMYYLIKMALMQLEWEDHFGARYKL